MSRPARRRRIDAPAMKKLGIFLRHLARTGSLAFAAERAGLSRNTLYRRRRTDPVFAAGWAEAIAGAVDRLLGAIRAYDNGLLMRLLRLYWPATYDRQGGSAGTPHEVLVRFGRK